MQVFATVETLLSFKYLTWLGGRPLQSPSSNAVRRPPGRTGQWAARPIERQAGTRSPAPGDDFYGAYAQVSEEVPEWCAFKVEDILRKAGGHASALWAEKVAP